MTDGGPPPIESVQAYPAGQPVRPHRGVMILVLGIFSLFCSCVIIGIIAWVLANNDLREMDAGRMDPSGRGLTQAGKVLGIISVVVAIIELVVFLLYMMMGGAVQGVRV